LFATTRIAKSAHAGGSNHLLPLLTKTYFSQNLATYNAMEIHQLVKIVSFSKNLKRLKSCNLNPPYPTSDSSQGSESEADATKMLTSSRKDQRHSHLTSTEQERG
jgi:hypothetical protein